MKIRVRLSPNGIREAREQVSQAKSNLKDKARELAEELARVGIQVAESQAGQYSEYIWFDMQSEDTENGARVVIRMGDRQKIIRKWYYKGGVREAEVSPSLMAEFGSGKFAIDGDVKGLKVGRGTFPEQKHAWEDSWHWTTLDGVRHTSSGETPTRPMYQAYVRMTDKDTIRQVAEKVFA